MRKFAPIVIATFLIGPAVADELPKAGMYCAPYGYGFPITFGKNGSAGIDSLDCERVQLSKGMIRSKKCYANGGSVVPLNAKLSIRSDGSLFFNDVVYKYIGLGKTINDCPATSLVDIAPVRPVIASVPSLGTPEVAFRELIAFDRKGGNDVIFNRHKITQNMQRHLSSGLAKDWVAAHSTGENVFDAEVFSGRQSTTKANGYESIKLISNDGHYAKMQAVLRVTVDDVAHTNKQNFVFVNEGGAWKLDDIEYSPGSAPKYTLHKIARSFLPASSNKAASQ